MVIGPLLLLFFMWDRSAYLREKKSVRQRDRREIIPLKLHGKRNLLFLGGVLVAVFLPLPWREMAMISLALASFLGGPKTTRTLNQFSWHPIVEIAILFAGIFVTMTPALMALKQQAPSFGITEPWQFFWLTGLTSSFLDNAPSYMAFVSVAQGLGIEGEVVGIPEKILQAISIGAVFFGANSYIGNGPNFMVKSICDHRGFKAPTFLGYMVRAAVILGPLYGLIHWTFF
jgi:Na+/H+ antiporter NhaD/arsenite permease-like protein